MSIYIEKIKVNCQSVNEILKINVKWNLIGQEHFDRNLRARFFPGMQFLQNVKVQ